jgi:hypothetical protein
MYRVTLLKTGITRTFRSLENARAFAFEFEHLIPSIREIYR